MVASGRPSDALHARNRMTTNLPGPPMSVTRTIVAMFLLKLSILRILEFTMCLNFIIEARLNIAQKVLYKDH